MRVKRNIVVVSLLTKKTASYFRVYSNVFIFPESSSPAFDEFLNLIGERVRLKGFENYRAQLDNKSKLFLFHNSVN